MANHSEQSPCNRLIKNLHSKAAEDLLDSIVAAPLSTSTVSVSAFWYPSKEEEKHIVADAQVEGDGICFRCFDEQKSIQPYLGLLRLLEVLARYVQNVTGHI
jgi:hypothetical protein